MKRIRVAALGIVAGAVCALGASSASADGYRPTRYSAPTLSSWTGFYFGAHAGGVWQTVDWADVSLTGERVNNDSSGFIGGGQIGYNFQTGNVVFGVEASISGTTLDDTHRSTVNPAAVRYSTDIDTIATVTGRLGIVADRALIYVKAGWAGANVGISGTNTALPDSFSIDDWRNGWTVGGGVEMKVTRNVSLGLEYSYIDLGSENYTGVTTAANAFTITDHDTQIHSVTARLNVQLYRDEYRPLK
ncbi:MAG TPA: outer membrane protein [Hyphomicrobiaceae bacterium]|nr:outer membrane protein [Hyphomicrobiaceae bacterium]